MYQSDFWLEKRSEYTSMRRAIGWIKVEADLDGDGD